MSVHHNQSRTRIHPTDLLLYCLAIAGCAFLLLVERPTAAVPQGLTEIDAVAHEAASRAGPGNMLVSVDSNPDAVSILHPRAVYALWPKRLFAVSPDVVILNSEQIGPATRPADPAFLKSNNISAAVRFGISNNRLIVEQVDPITP